MRKWHRIMDGEESAPAFAGQRTVVVEAIADVNGRQVIDVVRMVALRCAFDERGRMDRARDEARMRLTVETLDYPSLEQPANVRSLAPRIAARRLAAEFEVTLSARQRDAVLRAIWKS